MHGDMKGRIGQPRLEVMDKGFEIEYLEFKKEKGASDFDPLEADNREFGYSDDQFDKVMEDFKKIVDFYRSDANKNMKEPPEIG